MIKTKLRITSIKANSLEAAMGVGRGVGNCVGEGKGKNACVLTR
jgi:hypothetical protein